MENQIEKNLRKSFSFVKRDLIAVNEAIADLKTKIQHISLNQASLLSVMEKLRNEIELIRIVKEEKRKRK
jgi:hypothetical protein